VPALEEVETIAKGAHDGDATAAVASDGTPIHEKADGSYTFFENDTSGASSDLPRLGQPAHYSTYGSSGSYSSNYSSGGYRTTGGAWTSASDEKYQKKSASAGGFVGLCNQGATCYMNSLIQALFMTPEFRKALYDWEYSEEIYIEADKCIPFQLQKLFALLQYSERSAVETKGLTTSFGWEGADAFSQHDVQELCRKLFEALEEVFKGSPLETTVADLFEGTCQSYVKCHGCNHESAIPDKFMDLSLVIRPWGAQGPDEYNKSVEEAIEQYIKPELLDGDNKYACDNCGNRCNADKGIKLTHHEQSVTQSCVAHSLVT
jgi:ubiquitin C-terminal hydrolase